MSIKCFYSKGANYIFAVATLVVLLMGHSVQAQNGMTVSGVVSDESGVTLPGVNVIEKGTQNGVATDIDGKFSLKVAGSQSVLVFSYLGYETLSQAVGKKKEMSVVLKSADNKLDEVVVIGYGTARKQDLTGSVSTVSGDDLKKLAMANVAETLTGRLAGVQVTSAEGSPDSQINIRVRGGGSLFQESSPLLIVDGFPVSSISDIAPADIDKITVLKDASSTAIYGSRGAYGVIIITTKRGTKDNKLSVNYNTFYGVKYLTKTFDVLNPEDFNKWQYEYAVINQDIPSYEDYFGPYVPGEYAGETGTDWQREIYGNVGETQAHDFSVRGGSEKMNYSFNYSRYDEKAIMLASNYRRDNLSFSLKNKVNDKIDLTFTARYADTKIGGGGANEQNEISSADSRLKHAVGYSPIPLPGITTDNTDEALSSYLVNPFVAVADNQREQTRKNYNFQGSFQWKILKGLQLKSDFGLDNYNYIDNRFYGRSTYYVRNIPAIDNQGLPALVIRDRDEKRFRNANTLTYDFKNVLGDQHKLSLLVGEESINFQSNTQTTTIHAFPKFFDFNNALSLSGQGKPFSVNNVIAPDDDLVSFFARAEYGLLDKYLVTGTFRADGSSKFLGNNRWGYFPSAALAWKISNEAFLKDVSWIDLIKIRASYGEAGNNNIPPGQTIQNYFSGTSAWINNVTSFWAPTKEYLANPDLKWETTVTKNLGLDFEFFNSRISGTVETYDNVTNDLLIPFPIGSPYETQWRNMGEVQNKGIEANVNLVALNKKNYGLDFGFNINFNKNRVNSLGLITEDYRVYSEWASSEITSDFIVKVGQPIGLMYGYQNDGRYEVSDFTYDSNTGTYTLIDGVTDSGPVVGPVRPGMMKLKDINGDGVVDVDDRSVIGNAQPKYSGGFVLNANAYGFDLMAAFNFSVGQDVYNANKIEFTTATQNSQYRNLTSEVADGVRWTNLDANGTLVTDPDQLAALNANTTMWSPNMTRRVFSDWAVEDGSFLRLNTLQLGYTLPQQVYDHVGITKLRFYATCNNVFVLTNYSGPDPEVSTRRKTPLTPGVDYSAYPRGRQFSFGLNLNF